MAGISAPCRARPVGARGEDLWNSASAGRAPKTRLTGSAALLHPDKPGPAGHPATAQRRLLGGGERLPCSLGL